MKFQFSRGRSRSTLPLDSSSSSDGGTCGITKSPANVFWILLHCLCCLISLIIGFRFSRLIYFLLISNSTNNLNLTPFAVDIAGTLTFKTSIKNTSRQPQTDGVTSSSRVVVGRHGIRIRPWPHPNPDEIMKAHRIIETVQREQKVQYGIKNPRTLIIVTPTYVRTFQALHLTGLMHTLMNLPYHIVWIVVESGGVTNETAWLLSKSKSKSKSNSKLEIKHIGFEKQMPIFWDARHKLESEMRLQALRVVREEKLDGIVMFADDSNMHSLELFDDIQKVEWIGAVSVGILIHTSCSDEDPFKIQTKNLNEKVDKKSAFPIQGPACNSSDHLIGWHTFNSVGYEQKTANYIGDMAIVFPRKLEWCGFVMNSRLVWEESEFRPEWIKDFDVVAAAGGGDDEIENPLSFVEDTSMVEPLGGCGKKVMMWWLRAEARADSKFPSGWTIDTPLEVTVPAKRTPWPDAFESNDDKVMTESAQKKPTKTRIPRSRRTSQGKRKHEARNTDAHVLPRSSG